MPVPSAINMYDYFALEAQVRALKEENYAMKKELEKKNIQLKEKDDKIEQQEKVNEYMEITVKCLQYDMNILKVAKKAVEEEATKKVNILEDEKKKMIVAIKQKDVQVKYLMTKHVLRRTISEESTEPSSSFQSKVPNNEKIKEEDQTYISVPRKKKRSSSYWSQFFGC